jgi:haloalkane dehalogenase
MWTKASGPPILLLHGNPTWSFLYRNLIRQLRGRFRCIAVDYLGFGLSERPRSSATRRPSTQRSSLTWSGSSTWPI